MDEAEAVEQRAGAVSSTTALAYRDGLLIALLSIIPLRRRSVESLRLGDSVIRLGSDWTVAVAAEATKSGRPLEYGVPQDLGQRIDTYLGTFRPAIFGSRSHEGLWASAKGRAATGDGLYQAVLSRTARAFGFGVHLHEFRHAAATFIAEYAPSEVRAAADLLGHPNHATTERHYIQARSVAAGRKLTDAIHAKLAQLKAATAVVS